MSPEDETPGYFVSHCPNSMESKDKNHYKDEGDPGKKFGISSMRLLYRRGPLKKKMPKVMRSLEETEP